MAYNYGVFSGILTSELGMAAGQETWSKLVPQLSSYIQRINILQDKLKNKKFDNNTEEAELLKEAYATIMQLREILTGSTINYRIYLNDSSSTSNNNFVIKSLSMQELLNNGVSFDSVEQRLQIAENGIQQYFNELQKQGKQSELQQVSKAYEYEANRRLSMVKQNVVYGEKNYWLINKETKKYKEVKFAGYRIATNLLSKDNYSKYWTNKRKVSSYLITTKTGKIQRRWKYTEDFKFFNEGHIIEGVERSMYEGRRRNDNEFNLGTFFNSQMRFDSVSGFKGGDVGNWQIKKGNANLMSAQAINNALNKVTEILKGLSSGDLSQVSKIQNLVKESFMTDKNIQNNISNMIDRTVNNIMNEFVSETKAGLTNFGTGATVSWS